MPSRAAAVKLRGGSWTISAATPDDPPAADVSVSSCVPFVQPCARTVLTPSAVGTKASVPSNRDSQVTEKPGFGSFLNILNCQAAKSFARIATRPDDDVKSFVFHPVPSGPVTLPQTA